MKKIFHCLTLLFLSVFFTQCQKELSALNVDPNTSKTVKGTVQGSILDENNQPVQNALVKVGTVTTNTDDRGYFRITNITLDRNASLVVAERSGYFKAYRSFNATTGANQVMIKLIKKTLAGSFTSAAGGEVTLNNGAKVSLPANGVVLAGGASYSGEVKIYAAYIDPSSSDIARTVPGSFMANDKDNKRVALASYGMMAVELESASGQKLQVKAGNNATLTSPIPASLQSSAPSSISLWYVDEQTGIWREEGTATKSGSNYVGQVKHFSFWNCDIAIPAVNISLTLKNEKGIPLVHVPVKIRRTAEGTGSAYGWTDSLGQVSGLVPANENLVMEIIDPCNNPVYSKNIGPFTENKDFGTITVALPASSTVTIKGKLQNCSGTGVSKGYAIIALDNIVHTEKLNQSGEFSSNFLRCSSSSSFQIVGVDDGAQQQGSVTNVAVTGSVTDAGTISACGTSAEQFITYTLDGTNYNISSTDSLFAYDSLQAVTYITGAQSANNKFITFEFAGKGTGTHPMLYLYVQALNANTLVQPFNVNVTRYPQTIGEFYEGSFSGQFRDAQNKTHNINCSFKVRRQ